jgi:hypothetical protein
MPKTERRDAAPSRCNTAHIEKFQKLTIVRASDRSR